MRRFLAGVVATLLIEASLALLVIGAGGAPVNADRPPSTFETRLLGTAVRASVARQAASESELPPPSTDDLTTGAEIYNEMCARCHGNSRGGGNALGASFYPPAPRLTGRASTYSERELFWIIKHGIRNPAMPAWRTLLSDEDIRQVTAVVKRFDILPASTATRDSADEQ
jgi:mono/diheme cytochrome c family protein